MPTQQMANDCRLSSHLLLVKRPRKISHCCAQGGCAVTWSWPPAWLPKSPLQWPGLKRSAGSSTCPELHLRSPWQTRWTQTAQQPSTALSQHSHRQHAQRITACTCVEKYVTTSHVAPSRPTARQSLAKICNARLPLWRGWHGNRRQQLTTSPAAPTLLSY